MSREPNQPTQVQRDKLADWDRRNAEELAAIKAIEPSRDRAREVALRIMRLKKSVKAATRYARDCRIERAALPVEHENWDGQ